MAPGRLGWGRQGARQGVRQVARQGTRHAAMQGAHHGGHPGARHGARQAVPKLDTYLTRLANEESQRRLTLGNRYCQDAKALFTEVLLLRQADLIAFASSRASTPLPLGRVTLIQNRLN